MILSAIRHGGCAVVAPGERYAQYLAGVYGVLKVCLIKVSATKQQQRVDEMEHAKESHDGQEKAPEQGTEGNSAGVAPLEK